MHSLQVINCIVCRIISVRPLRHSSMKTNLLYLSLLALSPFGLNAKDDDGRTDVFPLLVMVTDEDGLPIRGASVQLKTQNPPSSTDERDPARKVWMNLVGRPAQTDERGTAVLFFFGRQHEDKSDPTFSFRIQGDFLVSAPGFERFEWEASEMLDPNQPISSPHVAPFFSIVLERKKPAK